MQFRARRIGILTGGGDCPGLNAVIRAVTRAARDGYGATVLGIEDGFEGLVEGRMHELSSQAVSGIVGLGGTILGTSSKGDPAHYPVEVSPGKIEIHDLGYKALRNIEQWSLDALIAIGGDGTMHNAQRLADAGVGVVGVPKTIDNDVPATEVTFGFDSATSVVCAALDRLETTASSHHRVMVVEVMGRYAGWIALVGGMSSGADLILIPEIAFQWEHVYRKVHERQNQGKRFTIVCVAEGAKLPDGDVVVRAIDMRRTDAKRLGGIAEHVAEHIEQATGYDTRVMVLGHLQRGGSPTVADRVLATRFGVAAADCACRGETGVMVAMHNGMVRTVSLADATGPQRTVPLDHELLHAARATGISFGDA